MKVLICIILFVSTLFSMDKSMKEELASACANCHGVSWELSTNGERLVSDMNEYEILVSLLAYKNKKIKSTVMNFYMAKYSDEEIEQMAKYISHQEKSKD
ncbi:c-type cytochrome [Poseidonibacter lekithochrous]|uniref:c-type cytochrome n=1 Tax=Poseidonibacter lekithochrous TaxID=1904463 RepID=UPI000D372E59|nr:cytochrome c-553 [Poseidonibacter lekithochrous]